MSYTFSKLTISLMLIIPLLLCQAIWIFIDAKRRGESYYWLWGFLGLLNVPSALIIYLLVTRHRQVRCEKCGEYVAKDYKACPFCGNELKKSCPGCGHEVEGNWNFCPCCAKNLKKE